MKLLNFKKIKAFFVFEFNSLLNYYNFWRMKRKANKLHLMTKKRYHVVPMTETKLMVVDNNWIKHYNKYTTGKKINIHDLIKMSYYSTK